MTLADFFWLDDAKFAERLTHATTDELLMGDKHNVRKRKGGKLGAWVGTAQAPLTLGISLVGTGIGVRNRAVAKRRLDMIHAELARRGVRPHAEDWKDAAFAVLAVGAGTAVGMGFAPGAEAAAQGFAEVGASHAAQYLAGVATSEVAQNVGSVATEASTAHFTDPDTYFLRPKEIEVGGQYYQYGQPCVVVAEVMPSPPAGYWTPYGMPTPTSTPPPPGAPTYMPTPPAPVYW